MILCIWPECDDRCSFSALRPRLDCSPINAIASFIFYSGPRQGMHVLYILFIAYPTLKILKYRSARTCKSDAQILTQSQPRTFSFCDETTSKTIQDEMDAFDVPASGHLCYHEIFQILPGRSMYTGQRRRKILKENRYVATARRIWA